MSYLYHNLRVAMRDKGYEQKDLCEYLERSQGYITARMTAKLPWAHEDIYKMMLLLKLPLEDIYVYFPPGGLSVRTKEIKVFCEYKNHEIKHLMA